MPRHCLSGLVATTARTADFGRHPQRVIRAQIMTRAAIHDRFREVLAREQQRFNDRIADLWRELQRRGLFDASVDPRAGAIFVQAYNLGLVVNDMSQDPVDDDVLTALIAQMLQKSFFA